MDRLFFAYGAIFAGLAVASGAFGAHALRERLSPEMLAVFETGCRYEMYHALALLAVAWAVGRFPDGYAAAAGWCFIAGILLFSGSLHVLAVTGTKWLGAITPFGGLAFLLGWILLAWTAWRGV